MYSSLCDYYGETFMFWFILIFIALFGLLVGSFLNVVIYRLPLGQGLVKTNSHCFSCGSQINWYDNIPLVSYALLRGRCRVCKSKISIQYPLVEALNSILWILIYVRYQLSIETLIYCIMTSVLLALAVIDLKTFEIPRVFNIILVIIGLVYTCIDYNNFINHLVGLVCVSGVLFILWFISAGRWIGFGDVLLMASTGIIVGWQSVIVGFYIGCVLVVLIYLPIMKILNLKNKFAFGPYLSAGIYISIFVTNYIVQLFIALLG